MTYLHPSGASGDGTRGGDLRRHRARHDGAAPDPYEQASEASDGQQPDPYWPGDYRYGPPPPDAYGEQRYVDEVPPASGGGRRAGDRYPVADHPTDQYPATRHPADDRQTAQYPAQPRAVRRADLPVDPHPDQHGHGPSPYPDNAEPARRGPGRRRRGGRRGRAAAERGGATRQDGGTTGRAGRNLPAAIAVGVTLVALVLASLYLYKPAFLAVVVLAVGLGTWEMARAVRPSGAHPPLPPLLAGGAVMGVLAWLGGADALSLGLLVTVLAALVWRLADGPANFQRDVTTASLIAVYVPFLAGFAILLSVPADGPDRVLVTLAAVVLSDTGGYVAGVFFGKHAMAPTVSPKKSWEGLVGSLLATAVGSAVLLAVLLDVAPWWGAVFGLAVSVAAVLGDLAESMIKRDLGVKDMSSLLPGHGGLMDRLDSILFAVPTSYLVLSLLLPPVV